MKKRIHQVFYRLSYKNTTGGSCVLQQEIRVLKIDFTRFIKTVRIRHGTRREAMK